MFKKNYKMIICFVLGIIVSSIGVYAASLSSSEVAYNNKETGISSDNLQGAIDELYSKAKNNQVPDITKLPNLVSALTYHEENDADYCITGDEETCKVSDCYKNKTQDSCEAGTIINYKVNNSKIVRFHVVHDDGETMTLQSQQNTLNSIQWYSDNDNTKGPITSLDALENVTKDWINVNTFDYSIYDSKSTLGYSGCFVPTSCSNDTYNLTKKQVRSRMITAQETSELGCTTSDQSCSIWVYNYLVNSKSFGGTANDSNAGTDYWTMSANAKYADSGWRISSIGYINGVSITNNFGVRAVVVINK